MDISVWIERKQILQEQIARRHDASPEVVKRWRKEIKKCDKIIAENTGGSKK